MLTIPVRYSCTDCGLISVACRVRARGETEDVIEWTNAIIRELSDDHRKRSPACHPATLKNIMIPIEGAERIGDPPSQ